MTNPMAANPPRPRRTAPGADPTLIPADPTLIRADPTVIRAVAPTPPLPIAHKAWYLVTHGTGCDT